MSFTIAVRKANKHQSRRVPESSDWFKAFSVSTLDFLTVVMILYCPAFLLTLPDSIFNLQQECKKESEQVTKSTSQQAQGNGIDRQPNPTTHGYGSFNQDQGTAHDCTLNLLQRENGSIQDQTRSRSSSDNDSDSTPLQGDQYNNRPISRRNESVNQSVYYLDDASPVTFSTLFGKYTQNFTDLISFNIKLAFIFCCVFQFLCTLN